MGFIKCWVNLKLLGEKMEIYNKNTKFVIFGTGDNWGLGDNEWTGNMYDIKTFEKLFLKNDISLLKEVFLNKNVAIEDSGFYVCNDMANNNMNRYGDFPSFIRRKKSFDRICVALTKVYKRLFNELETKEERKLALDKFCVVMTTLGFVNCEFAQRNCNEFVPMAKYVLQFTKNDNLQQHIFNNVYNKLLSYADQKHKVNGAPININLVHKTMDGDGEYLLNVETGNVEDYTDNDDLPVEERRKRFCDAYREQE